MGKTRNKSDINQNKKCRKIVESSIILNPNIIKQRLGFFNLSPYLVRFVLKSYKIPNLK